MPLKNGFALFLSTLVLVTLTLGAVAPGQALNPSELKNPAMRALQEKYFPQLQSTADEIHAHVFPNSFYASRVLDLELAQQEKGDQRSLRFDSYKGKTVVELTGNYFAAYPEGELDKNHRAAATFQDVILPVLQIAVPAFQDLAEVDGFALEVSHQVRSKVMGSVREHPENLVVVLDRDAAVRLVSARTDRERQAALLEGQIFINAAQVILTLRDDLGKPQIEDSDAPSVARKEQPSPWRLAKATNFPAMRPSARSAPAAPPAAVRDTSREALSAIQASLQGTIDKIVSEMDGQAGFVSYAPPSVVSFRKGAYLEFSVNSKLPATVAGSRYKLAALAFDDHIAHLVRPVAFQFQGDTPIDGIAFSTTIHTGTATAPVATAGKTAVSDGTQAVEFFLPLDSLRCYESYDCTGQQLIDAGTILIDGERVSLDLQTAEADAR
jgi:hypothetical protein